MKYATLRTRGRYSLVRHNLENTLPFALYTSKLLLSLALFH
jgi:hypothetical protein